MQPKLKIFMFGKKKEIKETLEALVGKRQEKEVYVTKMPCFEMISYKTVCPKGIN